jgi:hypothetical protein
LQETGLAVVPFSKRPFLALLNEDLAEEVVADWTVEIRYQRITAAKQRQLRHFSANRAVTEYVSIDVPWNAPANFLDQRQLKRSVWERDPDCETVEHDAIVGQLKTTAE